MKGLMTRFVQGFFKSAGKLHPFTPAVQVYIAKSGSGVVVPICRDFCGLTSAAGNAGFFDQSDTDEFLGARVLNSMKKSQDGLSRSDIEILSDNFLKENNCADWDVFEEKWHGLVVVYREVDSKELAFSFQRKDRKGGFRTITEPHKQVCSCAQEVGSIMRFLAKQEFGDWGG